jgi:hypothetical protein
LFTENERQKRPNIEKISSMNSLHPQVSESVMLYCAEIFPQGQNPGNTLENSQFLARFASTMNISSQVPPTQPSGDPLAS